jgi:hypothetical protein
MSNSYALNGPRFRVLAELVPGALVRDILLVVARQGSWVLWLKSRSTSSYNQKLWIRDRLKGATYPPS